MTPKDQEVIRKLIEIVDFFIERYTMEHPYDRSGDLRTPLLEKLEEIKSLVE